MLWRSWEPEAGTPSWDPELAAPVPPAAPLPILKYLWTARKNAVAAFHADVYRQWIVETKHWKLHTFIVNDPAAIRHVLVDNADNYVKGTIEPRIASAVSRTDFIAKNNWRDRRRTMSSALQPRGITGNSSAVLDATQALLERWRALPDGAVIDVSSEMARLTLEIMSAIAFSSDSAGMIPVMEQTLARNQAKPLFDLLDFAPLLDRSWAAFKRRRARRALNRVTAFIHEAIRKRSAGNATYDDLLGRLMRERNAKTRLPLSNEEIQNQIATFIEAGCLSISFALTWTLYLLSQHPAEEARLHAELREVLSGHLPASEDISRLRYTRMVIEEALRLYPPLHTLPWRGALDDDEVSGVRIPKGATITIVPWILHRHEKLWDRPGQFEPSRFSRDCGEGRPGYAYLPFGAGPRGCIGPSFMMVALAQVVAAIAQRYRLRLLPNHPIEVQGLAYLGPRHGLKMTVEKRR